MSSGSHRRPQAEFPTTEQNDGSAPMLTALRATVTSGPDVGKSFLIDPTSPQRLLLGTSPVCDIGLTDPMVSRRHAALEPAGPLCRITDLGSTNGTFINKVRVVDGFVRGGESLRCGSTVLRLEAILTEQAPPNAGATRFGKTLGASAAMQRLYPLCRRLAEARLPVLIEGEAGTGKELMSESLHDVGGAPGAFIAFDCNATPGRAEAELFGYMQGAFGGATADRPGLFEQASDGTLLLDEVGDLPLELQAKLHRALDRGETRRIGGTAATPVSARVIMTTRRNLDREVAAGRFRDDLFRMLAPARIELPPLRERHGDVTLLARHFAERFGAAPDVLTESALAQLEDYAWPGNVRELHNAVARRLMLGEVALGEDAAAEPAAPLDQTDINAAIDAMIREGAAFAVARRRAVEAFERRYVAKILDAHGGNVAKASAASGLARRYFLLVKARVSG